MRDPLDDLVGAYRSACDGAPGAAPSQARVRLMRSVHRQHDRRRAAGFVAVFAMVLLTNTTTWAWSTGRAQELLATFSVGEGDRGRAPSAGGAAEPNETVAAIPTPRPEPPTSRPEIPVPSPEDEPPIAEPDPAAGAVGIEPRVPRPGLVGASAGRTRSRPAPRADPRPTESSVSAPEPPSGSLDEALAELETQTDVAERRLFRRAHDLHFSGDYDAALAGWDRYLQRYPRGRFAPESRYNRAIALLRLGNTEDARRALQPLAAGRHGTTHTAEARALLDAIDEGRIRAR